MKTAIITGASSGLGRELARQIEDVFPDIECYWLISRRADRLESLSISLPGKTTVCLPLDLCDPMSFIALQERLTAERPEVALLVNCAGCGYLGRVGEMDTASQIRMVDLNVRALTAVTNIAIPYMPEGARILNVSSFASFSLQRGPGRGAAPPQGERDGGVPRPDGYGVPAAGGHHGALQHVRVPAVLRPGAGSGRGPAGRESGPDDLYAEAAV